MKQLKLISAKMLFESHFNSEDDFNCLNNYFYCKDKLNDYCEEFIELFSDKLILVVDKKYENQGVWILDKFHPKRIDIQTGAASDSEVEVISEKLNEGDLIILEQVQKGKQAPSKNSRPMRMF